MLSLTSHLDKYKTGKMVTVEAVIINAPGRPVIERIVPEYRAPLGDLLNTRDELRQLRYGWVPDPFTRNFMRVTFVLCLLFGALMFAVPFDSLPFSEEHQKLTRWLVVDGAISFGICTLVLMALSFKRNSYDRFVLDVQLGRINGELNALVIEWGDGNGSD